MAYDESFRQMDLPHNIIIENRSKLSVLGVESVDSFDEEIIVVNTTMGTLVIRGSALHMEKLSLDTGEIDVTGTVDSLEYENNRPASEGLFSRLFK